MSSDEQDAKPLQVPEPRQIEVDERAPSVPPTVEITGRLPAAETVPAVEPWTVKAEEMTVPPLEDLWRPSEQPEDDREGKRE